MARALLTVEGELDGETFVTTHGLINGVTHVFPPAAADYTAWGTDSDLSETGTNPTNFAGDTMPTILQAIIMLHRMLQWEGMTLKKLYIGDGKKNSGIGGSSFWTYDLGYGCDAFPDLTASSIVPGNTTLQINRKPFGFNNRSGRMFLRLALLKTEVKPIGLKLIGFESPAQKNNVQQRFNNALADSKLDKFLRIPSAAGTNNSVCYGLPSYYPDSDPASGQLSEMTPVQAITMRSVGSRQVDAGRREKKKNVAP